MGRERYPTTRKVMVTADCGGSNGPRLRLWKVELQRLADETGLTFQICHYPPGTSKWNKIEHRMFCHITQNWRATPLTSRVAVVELIASTKTKTGLTIRCELDLNTYPKGIKVRDEEIASLNLKGDKFHLMFNQLRAAVVGEAGSKPIHQANRLVRRSQQQRTGVRRYPAPVERCHHRATRNRCKFEQRRVTLCRHRGTPPLQKKSFSQKNFRRFGTPMHLLAVRYAG